MFLSASVSEQLTWHSSHHSQDGKMRHPVDSVCWSSIDKKYPTFASNPRNLRFGLATDGFNPFSPKQPGNDIDVYLQPLIDDLKLLWDGVDMYDAYSKAMFNLRDTILDVKGKSKIGAASRRDLELQELMEDVPVEAREDMLDSSGPYTLTKPEKAKFLWRLWMQRFPDGYCSNIENCIKIKDSKILGLKSHDHHVLMQQLLSVAVKGILPEGVRKSLFRLSSFFHELCQRVLDKKRLEELEDEIVETLCLLERYFPPSFFSIMIHLTIHIAREAKLCGSVHYRWMYPFERYMKVLKGYVRNRAAPEGSIAENYLADECVRVHKEELRCSDQRLITDSNLLEKVHLENFVEWLKAKIKLEADSTSFESSEMLHYLVKGPRRYAMSHSGFIINGNRFHTKEANVSTQDYGVHIEADTLSNYYGIIKHILVLDFYKFRLAVFLCDWANMTSGVKKVDGFTLVNLHEGLSKKDPFILASHAKQVFYSRDNEKSSWYVMLKAPPRGFDDLEQFDEKFYGSFVDQQPSALDIDNDDEVES
ncbi:hypothetical protein ACLB2K_041593 [Fragaria x ananassa]